MDKKKYIIIGAVVAVLLIISAICLVFINNNKQEPEVLCGYMYGGYEGFKTEDKSDLEGAKVYIYGVCTKLETTDGIKACIVENGDEKWTVGLWDAYQFEDKDFSFLLDKELYVFGKYLGYSNINNSPLIIFQTIICNGETYNHLRMIENATPIETGKISYNEFIERFEKMLIKMTEDESLYFIRDYEFVEDEPDVWTCKLNVEGAQICTIRLELEDTYINRAIFTGIENTVVNMDYTLIFQASFEMGMLGYTTPTYKNNEYYYDGAYSIIKAEDNATESEWIEYTK